MKNDYGKADMGKKKMPDIARGLLGARNSFDEDDNDGGIARGEADTETDDNDADHEGLHVASREMLDAAKADDHVSHAKALASFLTIHNKSEGGAKRKPTREDD